MELCGYLRHPRFDAWRTLFAIIIIRSACDEISRRGRHARSSQSCPVAVATALRIPRDRARSAGTLALLWPHFAESDRTRKERAAPPIRIHCRHVVSFGMASFIGSESPETTMKRRPDRRIGSDSITPRELRGPFVKSPPPAPPPSPSPRLNWPLMPK